MEKLLKTAFVISILLVCAGCSKNSDATPDTIGQQVDVSLAASLDDSYGTRTSYDAENRIGLWKREDMAGVIAGYSTSSFTDARMQPFGVLERNNNGKEFLSTATFIGKLTNQGSRIYTYYAVYPYTAFQSVTDASNVSSRLEERQYPDIKSWDGACDMLASKPITASSSTVAADNLQVQFTRLFGMLRLRWGASILDSYGSEVVETICIESSDATDKLAGVFTIDLTSSEAPDPVMSSTSGEYFNKIILDYRGRNTSLSSIDAYFVLNPGTYDNVTITVKTRNHTLTLPRKGLTVNRGSVASATINWKAGDAVSETPSLLPKNPSSLKVFTFGNSFMNDSMEYIDDLLNAAGVTNVTFAHFYIGSCSLEMHWNHVINKGNTKGGSDKITYYKRYYNGSKVTTSSSSKTVIDALCDEPWDVVVLQTVSLQVGFYEQYAEYLPKMIDYIKSTCQTENGKTPIIAWHMCWAFGTHSDNLQKLFYGNQMLSYEANVQSSKKVLRDTEIELCISTGTAIQSLRHSSMNNPYSGTNVYEFLGDGHHMDNLAGRYTVACTWFEYFMKPCFGKTVLGNTFMPSSSSAGVPVTAENREIFQRAAVLACQSPFEIQHMDTINPFGVTGTTEDFNYVSSDKGSTESFTFIDNLTW